MTRLKPMLLCHVLGHFVCVECWPPACVQSIRLQQQQQIWQSGWPTFKTRFSIQILTSSVGPVALFVSLLTLAYGLKTRVICEVAICELDVNTLEKYRVLKKQREL
jgi:hypothetical protein